MGKSPCTGPEGEMTEPLGCFNSANGANSQRISSIRGERVCSEQPRWQKHGDLHKQLGVLTTSGIYCGAQRPFTAALIAKIRHRHAYITPTIIYIYTQLKPWENHSFMTRISFSSLVTDKLITRFLKTSSMYECKNPPAFFFFECIQNICGDKNMKNVF